MLQNALAENVFDIMTEELGVNREEFTAGVEFCELGVDRIMSNHICDRVSHLKNLQLPSTVFEDYPTVEALQEYLQNITKPQAHNVNTPPPTHPSTPAKPEVPLSIILQGNTKTAKRTIFLLPDGSGSGMAYMKVPPIAPNVCLVAMNSPFLNSASDYTCRLENLSPLWIKEIRSRQATGPYILGGWSAGGYYSFEIAKQLLREGEKVEKLILIDSPCRLVFEELSMEVVTYLSENDLMGNWGAKGAPDWLIKHFGSSLKTIRGYMPTPLDVDESDLPEVFIIWAANGVLQDTGISAAQTELDTSRKTTQFLVVGRDDFGPVGWDRLFPGRRISIAKMPGHHFSIVHPPNSAALGKLLASAVEDPPLQPKFWEIFDA